MHYWLMKSEQGEFSIDDLAARPRQTEHWDGVRNYQARNMIKNDMRVADLAFFYHSNCETPGIVGIVEITREAYPDYTAFDSTGAHYDARSTPENPRWFMVDVRLVRRLRRTITLAELKGLSELEGFALIRKANRLSVMPVSKPQWDFILSLE